jgi:hypothetical protein
MLHEEAHFSADLWHAIIMERSSNQVQLLPQQISRQLPLSNEKRPSRQEYS